MRASSVFFQTIRGPRATQGSGLINEVVVRAHKEGARDAYYDDIVG